MFWKNVSIALISILYTGTFASFIQTPIPPSFNKNFFQDTNADGKMDRIVFQFLGGITQEYIDGMIDSIVVVWIDSSSQRTSFTILPSSLKIDSSYNRLVSYDFSENEPTQSYLTSLNESIYGDYGTAVLYQGNGEAIPISMKDQMAPVIQETFFKSYRGQGSDTLIITFSEPSFENQNCGFIVEYKSIDENVFEWQYSSFYWNVLHRKAFFILDQEFSSKETMTPRDSIRIKANCIMDSSKNQIPESTPFVALKGSYPLEIYTVNKATFIENNQLKNRPAFELEFLPFASYYPNDTAIGVGIDIGGQEFETVIREELRLRYPSLEIGKDEKIDLSKIKIVTKMSVFTSLGTYVASDEASFMGSDSRLENQGKRVFFRWNFLSDEGRFVQTGVYLVDVDVRISYNGHAVYQTKDKENRMQSWGVLRR